MALKAKGIKAGPKKRRARSEEEAIRRAVAENSTKPRRATRKSGRVKTYAYKEPEENGEVEDTLVHQLAIPYSRGELTDTIGADPSLLDALRKFQFECPHTSRTVDVVEPTLEKTKPAGVRCNRCGKSLRYSTSYVGTLRMEWQEHRQPGWTYDDWMALFTKDKTLWPYIIEEVLEEVANGN